MLFVGGSQLKLFSRGQTLAVSENPVLTPRAAEARRGRSRAARRTPDPRVLHTQLGEGGAKKHVICVFLVSRDNVALKRDVTT